MVFLPVRLIVSPLSSSHWTGHPSLASDPGLPSRSFVGHGTYLCFNKSWRVFHVHYGAAFRSDTHCGYRGKLLDFGMLSATLHQFHNELSYPMNIPSIYPSLYEEWIVFLFLKVKLRVT